MELDPIQILNTIDRLGISRYQPKSNGWVDCRCPYHGDKNIGNAGVNLSNLNYPIGLFKCFACGARIHIIGMVMQIDHVDKETAYKRLGQDYNRYNIALQAREKEEPKERKRKYITEEDLEISHKFKTIDINPSNWKYTSNRGYDANFVKKFSIKHCIEGWYKDYLITPIPGTNIFEARRFMEHEILVHVLKCPDTRRSTQVLRETFDKQCKGYRIKYKKGGWEGDLTAFGKNLVEEIKYLTKPKVLYPGKITVNRTLFNLPNLDYEEDVYLCEGIAGIPKIYKTLSKNVTAIFGAAISEQQRELISRFKKRVIIIPDNDAASNSTIQDLTFSIPRIWVLPVECDDSKPQFENELKKEPVEATRFLLRNSGLLEKVSIWNYQ